VRRFGGACRFMLLGRRNPRCHTYCRDHQQRQRKPTQDSANAARAAVHSHLRQVTGQHQSV